jgi:hypothetical protein
MRSTRAQAGNNCPDRRFCTEGASDSESPAAPLKMRKRIGLLKNNKPLEGMWSGHLVCCNFVGILFGTLLRHGQAVDVGGHDYLYDHAQHEHEEERNNNVYDQW